MCLRYLLYYIIIYLYLLLYIFLGLLRRCPLTMTQSLVFLSSEGGGGLSHMLTGCGDSSPMFIVFRNFILLLDNPRMFVKFLANRVDWALFHKSSHFYPPPPQEQAYWEGNPPRNGQRSQDRLSQHPCK